MKPKTISVDELKKWIVLDRTQLEVDHKDVEHYFGPITNIEDDGSNLTLKLLWRGDYDCNDDRWHGARAMPLPPFILWKSRLRIIEEGEKMVITGASGIKITFHPPEAPLKNKNDVVGLDIRTQVAVPED